MPETETERRLEAVDDARHKVLVAKLELTAAKKHHKASKDGYDLAIEALLHAGKPMPLFDQPPDLPEGEEWRATGIGVLGLSEGIAGKLIKAQLTTLGDIADWNDEGHELTEIEGIGSKASEQIMDVMDRHWAKIRGEKDAELEEGDGDA